MKNSSLTLAILAVMFLAVSCGKKADDSSAFKVQSAYFASYDKVDGANGVEETKHRFVKSIATDQLLDSEGLRAQIANFNQKDIKVTDPVDAFVGQLPQNYRRHFTLVHKSFSLQKATPLNPRVIMFGPTAQVIMTFNSSDMPGGKNIEVIEWKEKEKRWNFLELSFNESNKIKIEENPNKCVMCHSGTPKAIDLTQAQEYKKVQKPIFAQYPFWPGFYGSINDIVAVNDQNSRDTVMRSWAPTIAHIKSLTFSDTEELFRLRKLLDENPKYEEVIKNEMDVHAKYFHKFMDSIPSKERYRHLITLKDLYKNQKLPEHLKSAPYRRKFDTDYGHYLFRPNFYFSTLLTFYHSQYVASEIEKFPQYDRMKFSLLARKFNCSNIKVNDLDPSFNLVYPNIVDKTSQERQYLLAYQYNAYRASQGGPAQLPLHAWNLEPNEDIASYHYGNVFSDLNELVLWKLARNAIPEITNAMERSAAQDRHFEFSGSTYLQNILEKKAKGLVSRMNNKEMDFASQLKSYYGSETELKSQPVSTICDKFLIPKVKVELAELQKDKLPHELYPIDSRLLDLENLTGEQNFGTSIVRQSCESCHKEESKVAPNINVDWYSDTYNTDLHNMRSDMKLGDKILQVISNETLPVPFGNQMPFGRRGMDDFALRCEELIVINSMRSSVALKGKVFQCDSEDPQSLACRCEKMSKLRSKIYKDFFPTKSTLPMPSEPIKL